MYTAQPALEMPAVVQYPAAAAARMSFVDRLRPDLISFAPPWGSFAETVRGLVRALVAGGAVPSGAEEDAVRAILAREDASSTALLDIDAGVPHARLVGLSGSVVALAVSPAGLYEAVPTVPIHLVALVLSPPEDTSGHLRILAGIATLLRSRELRDALLQAGDATAALAVLVRYARGAP